MGFDNSSNTGTVYLTSMQRQAVQNYAELTSLGSGRYKVTSNEALFLQETN